MSNPVTKPGAPPPAANPVPPDAEGPWLDCLEQTWTSSFLDDLKLHHRMGEILTRRLGSPLGRRPAGSGEALRKASGRLGTPQAELLRMWRFFAGWPRLADFRAKYPKLDSWERVRAHFLNLHPETALKKERATVDRAVRALKAAAARLPEVRPRPPNAQAMRRLREAFRQVRKAAARCGLIRRQG